MIVLGIETSCDETAVGILEIKKTKAGFFIHPLSNTIASQIKIHRKYGGVVPMLASREHVKNIPIVTKKALKKAFGSDIPKIDLIAVTKGPGLILALLIGVNFAKTLAWKWNKPIIGVNHLEGHLFSFLPFFIKNKKKFFSNLECKKIFPSISLLVSGGNTQLIYVKEIGRYNVIGETRDDAAGECFDKGARILGLDYPGGPAIANEAAKHILKNAKLNIHFPRPMINSKNYDFSFSGSKTALLYFSQEFELKKLKKYRSEIAYEFQEAIVDVLIEKTIKAAKEFKTKSIILAGGVSANKRLKEKFQERLLKEKLKIKLFFPELECATDNAIMIAIAGFFQYIKSNKKSFDWKKIKADANLRLQ